MGAKAITPGNVLKEDNQLVKGIEPMTANEADVLLVGGGVMSTTLGMLLKELDPSLKIIMVEGLDHVAHESTDGWNNAGTGHAAYCELNYTTQSADGSVPIDRAVKINAAFERSLQFWSHLVERNQLPHPSHFINPAPHLSFVWGEKDINFLQTRYANLSQHHLFKDMEYSEDPRQLEQWMPLVLAGRDQQERVAATRVRYGSDVDFGSLTRSMVNSLKQHSNFKLLLNHTVDDLFHQDNHWKVLVNNEKTGLVDNIRAKFVFIGAGGASLHLLQKSEIPEADGFGGFPVSGQWLVCTEPEVVRKHHAKVYGQAPQDAPMSVPHLDTRIIDGKPALLFGPFAGFTTKFLKKGSVLDLLYSLRADNLKPIISASMDNIDLTKYLIGEVFKSQSARMESLRHFYPEAKDEDWTLQTAGQRVQIIKKTEGGGILQFGTEVVTSRDGSLAALLGASPGASIATQTMLEVIERCFDDRLASHEWQERMKTIIPSYGQSLEEDAELTARIRSWTLTTLGLA